MKPRLPNSLKAQAICILVSVFTLSHIASLLIYEHNRDQAIILTEATDLADRIIGVVNLARGFPSDDRERILAAVETQFLTLYPAIVSVDEVACQQNAYAKHLAERMAGAFADMPRLNARVCVRNLDTPQFLHISQGVRGFDVLVYVAFPDGEQATFHTILPEGTSLLKDTVVLYLLLVVVLALVLGWLMIKRATRPLEQLARAADEIGTNVDTAPMPERGPWEVTLAARAVNRMQARLGRLIHSQKEMLGAISHDLRSAVTRLQLRIELLEESEDKDALLRTVNDMRTMVQSVLDFSRGHNPMEPVRHVNLSALVESLCEDLIDEGLNISYHCEPPAIHLQCRPTDLRRSIQNVINNAITYAGSAKVSLHQTNHSILITVDDNGPGLPEDQLKAVVKPFYRADQSRSGAGTGVGLGLSITANILHSMGGAIDIKNRPEGGLRVTLAIPYNLTTA